MNNGWLLIALVLVAGCAAYLWWIGEGYQAELIQERQRTAGLLRQIQAYRTQAEEARAELAHIYRYNRRGTDD